MTDVIVIGGGVAGLSAAAALAPLCNVTLLEREKQTGYHSSGRSAALFEENYGKPTTRALNKASRDIHAALGVLSPRGLMIVGQPHEDEQFAADVVDMKLTEITLEEARNRVPILSSAITRAAHMDGAQDIDTDLLMQTWIKQIRAHGGTIQTGAEVTGITRTATGWRVDTGTDAHTAPVVVNAAGAWADVIARLAGVTPLGLTPLRRSMARLAAPGGHDTRTWPMIFGPGESWYAKPDAGALLVSPADEDPVAPMDAWPDDMVLAEGLARYQEAVTVPVTRPIATWAGLRTFAPDRSLVLGRDTAEPTFVWCAGQGGYGVQSSPAAGLHIADIIAERPPAIGADIAAQLSPARFDR
ncbi:glycerol-3-phosphate dehydrogenase [Loktanella sp. 3ANDIMAR09]|uniref:NAD(P)/FAD-dependent oxidoreductase n=1 Tax=Loktanella sp. 3ANDIMAR09 TaxID=1225657 RepID=UPI000700DA9A|nr:FAD-dependent oxidoreductase [Loktanella sp. 3ANDIMAR09]KQI69136.1 glycerol-3-phosphate dehydrogenase [Loktanella sp. 3ANDIMAR09]